MPVGWSREDEIDKAEFLRRLRARICRIKLRPDPTSTARVCELQHVLAWAERLSEPPGSKETRCA